MLKNKTRHIVIILSIVAAVLYNIWPLGYLLDPGVLQNSYVSVLEVSGKPYFWLFVLGDIITGIAVIVVGLMLRKINPLSRVGLFGYIVFGAATLIDAIIPITSRCEDSVSACGISPSQVISPHDLASLVAAGGLFTCLIKSKHRVREANLDEDIYKWLSFTFWAWSISGILLMISVIVDDFTTISQSLFYLACGLGLLIVPISLERIKLK